MKRISTFLIAVALTAGMEGCLQLPPFYNLTIYNLTITSTAGGSVTIPGRGTFTYVKGEMVNLVAEDEEDYRFANWTGDVSTIVNVNSATTTITMDGDYAIMANFEEIPEYNLTISCTEGGSVTTPGEGTFTYDERTVVDLVAEAEEGYHFANWTGDADTIENINAPVTNITMDGDYSIAANFAMVEILEIWDWYDLDVVRDNPGSSYILMNDLDSTTAGYEELASPRANEGKGWQPIGTYDDLFTGSFDGRGYEIRDLFINRTDESDVGLFSNVGSGGGVIKDIGVVNVSVTGSKYVGGLVGVNTGTVSNSYSSGNVTGTGEQESLCVGGLVGVNMGGGNYTGTVSNSYSTGKVTGTSKQQSLYVGGLVGYSLGTVSNSFWDIQTSGQATSAGGTGKTTAEMKSITTFLGAGWNIIAVANPDIRNTAYIWNIVDVETYPFLRWEPIS